MKTDMQRKLRQLLKLNAAEPGIGRIANQRMDAALEANAERLKRLSGNELARAIRKITLTPVPDPKAAWLIRHHIREARRSLDAHIVTVTAPMKGRDAILAGPSHHRIKVVRQIPDWLRNRLDPVFARGDLWDPDGEYHRRFDAWEADMLANLPPGKTPGKTWWPYHRDAFLAHLPVLEDWFAEVLDLFGEDDERQTDVSHSPYSSQY